MQAPITTGLVSVLNYYKRGDYRRAQDSLDRTDQRTLQSEANNPGIKRELRGLDINPERAFFCGVRGYDGMAVKLALSDRIQEKLDNQPPEPVQASVQESAQEPVQAPVQVPVQEPAYPVVPSDEQLALRSEQASVLRWQPAAPSAPAASVLDLGSLPEYTDLSSGKQLPDALSKDRLDDLRKRGLTESAIRKLQNPAYQFPTVKDQLSCLVGCIEVGRTERESVAGKDVIMILGKTGTGKSTTANVIQGHRMTKVQGGDLGGAAIVVDPRQEQHGKVAEVGHSGQSMTFIPDVVEGRYTICDCPGFADNRGSEISIANAVNIQKIVGSANSIRIILVVDYMELMVERGKGIAETAAILRAVLGNESVVERHAASIMVGVTKMPIVEGKTLAQLKTALCNQDALFTHLKDRIAIIDAIGNGPADWHGADALSTDLDGLTPLESPKSVLQIVLTEMDKQTLNEMMLGLNDQFQADIKAENYRAIQETVILMEGLVQLGVPGITATVERLLNWGEMVILGRVEDSELMILGEESGATDRIAALQEASRAFGESARFQVIVSRIAGLSALHDSITQSEATRRKLNSDIQYAGIAMSREVERHKATGITTVDEQLAVIDRTLAAVKASQEKLVRDATQMKDQIKSVYDAGVRALEARVSGDTAVGRIQREDGMAKLDREKKRTEEETDLWQTTMTENYETRIEQLLWVQSMRTAQRNQLESTDFRIPLSLYGSLSEMKTRAPGSLHDSVAVVRTRASDLTQQGAGVSVEGVRELFRSWGAGEDYIAQNFIGGDDWGKIFEVKQEVKQEVKNTGYFSGLFGSEPSEPPVQPVQSEFTDGITVPQKLVDFLQQDSVFNPSKKVWQDHMVCWIPAGISLTRFDDELFGRIGSNYHKDNAKFWGDNLSQKKADMIMKGKTERGGWCVAYVGDVTKDNGVIPNSRNKTWANQEKAFKEACDGKGYDIGKVRDMGVVALMRYIKTGDKILSNSNGGRPYTYARSPEIWATGRISGYNGGVGAFDADGLSICGNDSDSDCIGVAAARWFSGPLTL